MALTGKQRRALRALGHHLQVVVQVGQDGVTPGVVAAVEQALWDHELVKIRVASDGAKGREEAADKLATATGAEVAQLLGRTVLLYKANPDTPRIQIGETQRAPRVG
jgi:RNA-binding protein